MKFNLNAIGNIIGILLMINGFLMLTAVPFGLYFNENSFIGILISSFVNIAVGFQFYNSTKNKGNLKLMRVFFKFTCLRMISSNSAKYILLKTLHKIIGFKKSL